MPIITNEVILGLIQTALLEADTAAGDNVFMPRDWPVSLPSLPVIFLSNPVERKESKGPNAPEYDVYATIRVTGRVTQKAMPDNAAAGVALANLQALQRQIEVAVINNYELYLVIPEITSVETKTTTKSDGNQEIGDVEMDFTVKFYQGPEAFAPPDAVPLTEFAVYGDLLNVFDPNGTDVPPFPYPVPAAPRTIGPDGRVEIGAIIELPQ